MRYFLLGFMSILLASCATPQDPQSLIVTKNVVILPPPTLLVCDPFALPDVFVTNKDAGKTFVKLYNSQHKCANNMRGIKNFLNDAKKTVG